MIKEHGCGTEGCVEGKMTGSEPCAVEGVKPLGIPGELKMADTAYQTETDALRRAMGTLPELNCENDETKILKGVEGISAEIIDAPRNPYRIMFEVSVATWGNEQYATKWPLVSPENRFRVVKAALSGQTLPQAVEPVVFSFIIRGASRSAFDQHARQRLATFFSQGVRDNSRLDAGFRVPSEFLPENGGDPELFAEILAYVREYKRLYKKILKTGWGSFQSARALMPMGMTHNYKFAANLGVLKSYMAQRLQACEQADTVQVAIEVWYAIHGRFPLIASHYKPGCDFAKKCTYHQSSTLSEMFSALFAGCGRWPDTAPYATFNKSCSSYKEMGEQSGRPLPDHTAWKDYTSYDQLEPSDQALFNENAPELPQSELPF